MHTCYENGWYAICQPFVCTGSTQLAHNKEKYFKNTYIKNC
jgi:hypothetical protein